MSRPVAPALAAAAALALGACAETIAAGPPPGPGPGPPPAPSQKVVRVKVPVPVKCVPDDIGPPPAYPDTDLALRSAGGAADRYQLLAAGRLLRDERLAKLEDVLRRCRQAQRPPPG